MNEARKFRGVICPLLTPFDDDGQIDEDSTRNLLDYVIEGGVHGVMIAGSTGEGQLLNFDERKRLAECVIEHVSGRVPVIIHVGCKIRKPLLNWRVTRQNTVQMRSRSIVPYFFTYDDELLYMHFHMLGNAVPEIPLFPYVYPANAKNDIQPSLFRRLVDDTPSIVGIKSSNPNLLQLRDYCKVGNGTLSIFCGIDGITSGTLTKDRAGRSLATPTCSRKCSAISMTAIAMAIWLRRARNRRRGSHSRTLARRAVSRPFQSDAEKQGCHPPARYVARCGSYPERVRTVCGTV